MSVVTKDSDSGDKQDEDVVIECTWYLMTVTIETNKVRGVVNECLCLLRTVTLKRNVVNECQ